MSFTNELIHETSPYLLQHAHNPVQWFPWGGAAFAKARAEDKPVFLSIGYSTCHWCHVMAHESFEDLEVADCLNRDFVAIKVDREERPDIDGVYMRACQAMTGSGGWPTSIFMTAEGKPFYAGTYFPKKQFLRIAEAIAREWQDNRASLWAHGDQLAAHLASEDEPRASAETAPVRAATDAFRRSFDKKYGGFGRAPKFPSPHNLMFLLDTAPELAEATLEAMYRGGLFDHIGGGFSRYSTDARWLVPHFEKMLYDNALLAIAYLLAYEKTENARYRRIAERTLHYAARELRAPNGGFYSAQDADSEGEEGRYYLLEKDELLSLLGADDGERFCAYYGITQEGNFEGKNIPNLLHRPDADEEIAPLRERVYAYRRDRTPLGVDQKQLTAWNALMAATYAMAGRILGDRGYVQTARETLDFLAREAMQGDTVYVGVTDGRRSGPGFLDDYAYTAFALYQMHQATQDASFLTRAEALTRRACALFGDEAGGFFFSGNENEPLIARPKESWDGALPSGNSMMAYLLIRLALLTGDPFLEDMSRRQQAFMNGEAAKRPMGYGFYLYASLPVKKIICAGGTPDQRIRSDWAFLTTDSPEYPPVNGKTTYYVCENNTCLPPTNTLNGT